MGCFLKYEEQKPPRLCWRCQLWLYYEDLYTEAFEELTVLIYAKRRGSLVMAGKRTARPKTAPLLGEGAVSGNDVDNVVLILQFLNKFRINSHSLI